MVLSLHPVELDWVKQGFDARVARSASLPGRCYIDEKYLEIECGAIFKKSWQYVCLGEKLREPGCYVTFETQGMSLVALRDRKGVLRAFYNVCKHRAHELLKGEGKTHVITCPYHAWAYGLDGQLRNAPQSEHSEGFDKDKICLTAVAVEAFCGLIFVNLDPEARPLAELSGDLAGEINHYAPDLGQLTHAHRNTYHIESNWKNVIDNFLECYHCPNAHKDFVSLVDIDHYKVTTHGIYSSHMSKLKSDANSAYSAEGASVTDHAVWWLWPNICLLRFPGPPNFMVLNVIPIGPETTFETFDFFFMDPEPDKGQRDAIDYVDKVLQREDIDIVESVQRGMRTPGYERGRFMVDPEGGGMSEHGVHQNPKFGE